MAAFRQDGIREHTHHADTGTTVDEVDMPVDQSARQVFGCLRIIRSAARVRAAVHTHSFHWASFIAITTGFLRSNAPGERRPPGTDMLLR
jgi:hypothetical protein